MTVATDQSVEVSVAWFAGEDAPEASVKTEAFEGYVALHVMKPSDEDGYPSASLCLSPVDAAVLAERLTQASRKAIDLSYVP